MNDYSLIMFFLKKTNSMHEAVEKASKYIDWFSYEVREIRKV